MQDLNNDVEYLENAINQVDLINIIEHNIWNWQNPLFSRANWSVTEVDHMLGHKISLNKIWEVWNPTNYVLLSQHLI